MSYAIAQVIYGLPLNTNRSDDEPWSEELEDQLDEGKNGFLKYYSANSDVIPAAFGIELCEFDEGCDHVDISDLKLEPTEDQKSKYQELLEMLPDDLLKEVTKRYSVPRTFILWSSS